MADDAEHLMIHVYSKTRFRTDSPGDYSALISSIGMREVAIITGYATTGEEWSATENEEADTRLYQKLKGDSPIRITGYDPDSQHAEPGWAVETSIEQAISLGEQFKQLAIFFIKDGVITVHSTSLLETPLAHYEVGDFIDRLDKPSEK